MTHQRLKYLEYDEYIGAANYSRLKCNDESSGSEWI